VVLIGVGVIFGQPRIQDHIFFFQNNSLERHKKKIKIHKISHTTMSPRKADGILSNEEARPLWGDGHAGESISFINKMRSKIRIPHRRGGMTYKNGKMIHEPQGIVFEEMKSID
jgi:hypothetical protein